MALEIVWSNEAKEGLEDIIEYLENNWTEREIRRFFKRLEECLEKIKENPEQAKDSLRKSGAKEYHHSPQTTIFYSHHNNIINILRLWSNVKNPDRL